MTVPSPTTLPTATTTLTGSTSGGRGDRRSPARLSPRVSFVLRRLGRLVVSLALVTIGTFLIIHLVPGDPVRGALGTSASPELVARTRTELGLDLPLPEQFINYILGLFRGDFGVSLQTHRSVGETLSQRIPATVTLAVAAFIVAALTALPIGIATAISARSGRRRVANLAASAVLGLLIVVPNFLVAVGLISLFSIALGVLPAAGWGSIQTMILPVIALAVGPAAYLARIVHVEMDRVLDATYMTTARSKRLPGRLIYLRHAMPNILTATLTIGGLLLTGLVAATVLIETIFAIPGLGVTIVSAITTKDYPAIQGVVLVYAVMVLGVNLIIDLILVTVDPRSSILEG